MSDMSRRADENDPWDGKVQFRLDSQGQPFAFVDEVIVRVRDKADAELVQGDAVSRLGRFPRAEGLEPDAEGRVPTSSWQPTERCLIRGVPDPVVEAQYWRAKGRDAQPNHAVFATPVHGNPAAASVSATGGAPFAHPTATGGAPFAHPFASGGAPFAHPFGFYGAPWFMYPPPAPYGGSAPCCPSCGGTHGCSGSFDLRQARSPRKNLAEPAAALARRVNTDPNRPRTCRVIVLDTGLADPIFRPQDLTATRSDTRKPTSDHERPDEGNDGLLDPVAGHGTFIAGLISRLAPAAEVRVMRVLSPFGLGDDDDIASRIDALADQGEEFFEFPGLDPDPEPPSSGTFGVPMILAMSFGGYTEDNKPPLAMAQAVARFIKRGGVAVASAGNDATCRMSFPAALPNVIGVAALSAEGAASFTNYGNWVRACAPGQDVVSRFFRQPDPAETAFNAATIPEFDGWASWSGTSFSAPIVAGVLARAVCQDGITPQEAVARHIDDPRLLRIPGLGTVINEH